MIFTHFHDISRAPQLRYLLLLPWRLQACLTQAGILSQKPMRRGQLSSLAPTAVSGLQLRVNLLQLETPCT